MELINDVEIRYFRSIYQARIDKLSGVTVLFGRNDSGKSNVLRALNLFFNGETNPGMPFSFDRDLCHARLAEADELTGARKFVSVKLVFNTPSNWRQSLGPSFWVKKSWSITKQEDPNFESSIRGSTKQQYLTRFLNTIRFHYIPAIKDRRIFEYLLSQVYDVIASHEQFMGSLQGFSNELKTRTSELSDGLLDQLQLKSTIAPPSDLTDLFRSLDFETESEQGDSYSLTLQRGDGIQVRHIPAILAFLSDRSHHSYHIWGFEEPENSLELANAIEEAKRFCNYGMQANKQIFLTSHSPAFFALEEDSATRFFVSCAKELKGRPVSGVQRISANSGQYPGEMMGETPHLPVISHYLLEADREIRNLSDQKEAISRELAQRNQSLLFLEGESDIRILEAAWHAFCEGEMPFVCINSSGTTKMQGLAKDGQVINHLAPNRKVFVLVDNDREGRELYKNGKLDNGAKWIRHNSNGTYWCRLPWTPEFVTVMKRLKVQKTAWPGCIENLFSAAVRSEAKEQGVYDLERKPYEDLITNCEFEVIADMLADESNSDRFYVLAPNPDKKIPFAEWVEQKAGTNPEILNPLRPIVEWLCAEVDEEGTNGNT